MTLEELLAEQRRIKRTTKHLREALDSLRWNYEAMFETYKHFKERYEALEYKRMEMQALVRIIDAPGPTSHRKSLKSMSPESLEEFIARAEKVLAEKKSAMADEEDS